VISKKNRGATRKPPTESLQKPQEPTKVEKKKSTAATNPAERSNLKVWLSHHKLALTNAINRIKKSPIPTALTILVVGVALALPASLQVIIKNVEPSQTALSEQAQITLFIEVDAKPASIDAFVAELKTRQDISDVEYIPASKAWEEFQHTTGLSGSSSLLEKNPLPHTVIIRPSTEIQDTVRIESLRKELQVLPLVDLAKIDMLWVERLYAIIDFVKLTSISISIFLIFTVLIVIGNTIKMLGQNFHDEIIVSKLVGASDGYVRRPFLYSGVLYGFAGSCCAILFVFIGVLLLTPQLDQIAALYQTQIDITILSMSDILSLLFIGIILGLGGAWISANRLINKMAV